MPLVVRGSCRRYPSPRKRFVAFVALDFTGLPDLRTDGELGRLAWRFKRIYNTLSVANCDGLFREARVVRAQVFDDGIGSAATTENPALVTVIFRVEYYCRGSQCTNSGFLFAPDDIFMPANSNARALLSTTNLDIMNMDIKAEEVEEEEEEDEDEYYDDEDEDDDTAGTKETFNNTTRRLGFTSPYVPNRSSLPCGCTNPGASFTAPNSRQFVELFRAKLRYDIRIRRIKSFLSLLTGLEIIEQDCTGLGGNPGGALQEFVLAINLELEADPNTTTADERVLLANLLTSTYNYFSRINCDDTFFAIDRTVLLDELITIPDECQGAINRERPECAIFYQGPTFIPPGTFFGDQNRRRTQLQVLLPGISGGTCRGCVSKCRLVLCVCVPNMQCFFAHQSPFFSVFYR